MILLYIHFKRFLLNRKGLSDGKVVSLTKKNNFLQYIFYKIFFKIIFFKVFIKSLESTSDE